MRIAIVSPRPLDGGSAESEAAYAVAKGLADRGVEALVVGCARSTERMTDGRRLIRALEQAGPIALTPTDGHARDVVIGGPTMTWAAHAAIQRVVRGGDLSLVVAIGDEDTWVTDAAAEASPALERIGVTGAAAALDAVIKAAGDHARAPSPLAPADPITADFHLHTVYSPDCGTEIEDLVDRALELGLGALAVTDHDSVTGGYAARAYVEAHDVPLHIAVSSEVKTRTGEVIGMYLVDDIPPGLSLPTRLRRCVRRAPSSTSPTRSTDCTPFRRSLSSSGLPR